MDNFILIEFDEIYFPFIFLIRDLAYNEIGELNDKALIGLTNLKHLVLSHNLITQIKQQTFSGLINLQILDLSNNQIKFIHQDAFTFLPKIQDL